MIKLILAVVMAFTITEVHDGDTLLTSNHDKIRLSYIDCPELKQPFGTVAKDFTASKVLNKTVNVDVKKNRDKYGRLLGYVLIDNEQPLNDQLVTNGLAWSYNSAKMRKLEKVARNNKIGLWVDPSPIKPSDYRKNHGK